MAHSVHITTNAPAAETQSVAPEPAKKSAPPKSSAAHQDTVKISSAGQAASAKTQKPK